MNNANAIFLCARNLALHFCFFGIAAAAEGGGNYELRLRVGGADAGKASGDIDYTAGSGSPIPSGTYDLDGEPDHNPFIIGGMLTAPISVRDDLVIFGSLGIDLELTKGDELPDGRKLDASSEIGLRGGIGVRLPLGKRFKFEAQPFARINFGSYQDADLDTGGNWRTADGSTVGLGIGLEVGAYVVVQKITLGAFLFADHRWYSSTVDSFGTGGSYDATYTQSFLGGGVSAGYILR